MIRGPQHASHLSRLRHLPCTGPGQGSVAWRRPHLLALSEQMSLDSWSSLNHSLNYGFFATGLVLLCQVSEMEKWEEERLGSYFQWLKTPASLVPCLDKVS